MGLNHYKIDDNTFLSINHQKAVLYKWTTDGIILFINQSDNGNHGIILNEKEVLAIKKHKNGNVNKVLVVVESTEQTTEKL